MRMPKGSEMSQAIASGMPIRSPRVGEDLSGERGSKITGNGSPAFASARRRYEPPRDRPPPM